MADFNVKTIYAIQHNITKRVYVGVCQHPDTRIKKHMHDLLRGVHTNKKLQEDFDKYGMEFSFYIIDKVKKEDCFEKEKQWMNILRSNDPKKLDTTYQSKKHQ